VKERAFNKLVAVVQLPSTSAGRSSPVSVFFFNSCSLIVAVLVPPQPSVPVADNIGLKV
jgi:hypothetical protein